MSTAAFYVLLMCFLDARHGHAPPDPFDICDNIVNIKDQCGNFGLSVVGYETEVWVPE